MGFWSMEATVISSVPGMRHAASTGLKTQEYGVFDWRVLLSSYAQNKPPDSNVNLS